MNIIKIKTGVYAKKQVKAWPRLIAKGGSRPKSGLVDFCKGKRAHVKAFCRALGAWYSKSSALWAGCFISFALMFVFLAPKVCLFACDSTILQLLSGESQNQAVIFKLLSVSQKLKSEADMLNGFNIAAAKALHKEIMLDWLHLAPELIAEISPKSEYKSSYTTLINASAKDLGNIKRSLDAVENPIIQASAHDIIEKCATQISLLGAIMSNNKRTYEFLRGELKLYALAVLLGDEQRFLAEADFREFKSIFNFLKPEFSKNALNSYNKLVEAINDYSNKTAEIKNNGIKTVKTTARARYNNITNAFVKFKQELLENGYFIK